MTESGKDEEITELTRIWYQIVGIDHHKDRDCHWIIEKGWSYGLPAKYTVRHYGYVFEEIDQEFETYEGAEECLIASIKRAINDEIEWAKKIIGTGIETGEESLLINAKTILDIVKESICLKAS